MLKLAVLGASGRMGRAILGCVAEADDFRLTGAVTQSGDPTIGRDAGEAAGLAPFGVPLTDDRQQALHGAQVAVDFTLPTALEANVKACVETGTALVVGTTGLEKRHFDAMERAAHQIPIVYGRNMSVGVNLFMELVARAARALGDEYDVEIVEAHHRHKVDAPSGTALALGERVAEAKGRPLKDLAVYTRQGRTGPRVPSTIGFSVIRGGNIVGDHSVLFIAGDEQVEFVHRARDRRAFARGALRAARWVAGRAPGYYSMADVLASQRA
ncbi:MAG TPA: 4-hydroxy-tetrahydrodipicolinate reductase [Gammaproteobacteria bacterium]